jgi:hypothetical protein
MTIKELAGKVAPLIGGSRGNCALIAKRWRQMEQTWQVSL